MGCWGIHWVRDQASCRWLAQSVNDLDGLLAQLKVPQWGPQYFRQGAGDLGFADTTHLNDHLIQRGLLGNIMLQHYRGSALSQEALADHAIHQCVNLRIQSAQLATKEALDGRCDYRSGSDEGPSSYPHCFLQSACRLSAPGAGDRMPGPRGLATDR